MSKLSVPERALATGWERVKARIEAWDRIPAPIQRLVKAGYFAGAQAVLVTIDVSDELTPHDTAMAIERMKNEADDYGAAVKAGRE